MRVGAEGKRRAGITALRIDARETGVAAVPSGRPAATASDRSGFFAKKLKMAGVD
jgi:hypothetical protein